MPSQRLRQYLSSVLIVTLCLCAAVSAGEREWQSLFDGETFNGWQQHSGEAMYSVEDGCIVGTSVPNTGNSFLCTDQEYADFVFECWWKVDPALNSGIQFRSQFFEEDQEITGKDGKTRNIPADRVHGYQSEIDVEPERNRMWSVGVYDEARRGWLYPGTHGGDEAQFSAQGRKLTNVNGWNHVRIECIGESIRTFLNGELRADFKDDMTPQGIIALQVHGIGNDADKVGKQVRWRNIRIQVLD